MPYNTIPNYHILSPDQKQRKLQSIPTWGLTEQEREFLKQELSRIQTQIRNSQREVIQKLNS